MKLSTGLTTGKMKDPDEWPCCSLDMLSQGQATAITEKSPDRVAVVRAFGQVTQDSRV